MEEILTYLLQMQPATVVVSNAKTNSIYHAIASNYLTCLEYNVKPNGYWSLKNRREQRKSSLVHHSQSSRLITDPSAPKEAPNLLDTTDSKEIFQ